MRGETVEKRDLTGNDTLRGLSQGEPGGAVDFGEGLATAGFRRPFHLESDRTQRGDVEIALDGEGVDPLARLLADAAQRNQLAGQGPAGLLGKLAAGRLLGRLVLVVLALGDRPGAEVALGPEGSARMNEQDFRAGRRPAEQQDAGASGGHCARSSSSSVAGSGSPSQKRSRARSKTLPGSAAAVPNNVIDERNFLSSGLPKTPRRSAEPGRSSNAAVASRSRCPSSGWA